MAGDKRLVRQLGSSHADSFQVHGDRWNPGAVGYWGLFMLATRFEPQPKEVVQHIGTVKIRKQ